MNTRILNSVIAFAIFALFSFCLFTLSANAQSKPVKKTRSPYIHPERGFKITPPPGWHETKERLRYQGVIVAFAPPDPMEAALIAVFYEPEGFVPTDETYTQIMDTMVRQSQAGPMSAFSATEMGRSIRQVGKLKVATIDIQTDILGKVRQRYQLVAGDGGHYRLMASAPERKFPDYEGVFNASLDSFELKNMDSQAPPAFSMETMILVGPILGVLVLVGVGVAVLIAKNKQNDPYSQNYPNHPNYPTH